MVKKPSFRALEKLYKNEMNEQMMQKHLDFLVETGQTAARASAKEGVLWTNAYITK